MDLIIDSGPIHTPSNTISQQIKELQTNIIEITRMTSIWPDRMKNLQNTSFEQKTGFYNELIEITELCIITENQHHNCSLLYTNLKYVENQSSTEKNAVESISMMLTLARQELDIIKQLNQQYERTLSPYKPKIPEKQPEPVIFSQYAGLENNPKKRQDQTENNTMPTCGKCNLF